MSRIHWRVCVVALILLVAAACGGSPAKRYTAPAPASALECVLARATEQGYTPVAGGLADGYVRLEGEVRYSAGEVAKGAAVRVVTIGMAGTYRPPGKRLTATAAAGSLRLEVVALTRERKESKPTEELRTEAAAILAACGGGT